MSKEHKVGRIIWIEDEDSDLKDALAAETEYVAEGREAFITYDEYKTRRRDNAQTYP